MYMYMCIYVDTVILGGSGTPHFFVSRYCMLDMIKGKKKITHTISPGVYHIV